MSNSTLKALLICLAVLLASCATSYDLTEKYTGVVGKQYRTRSASYLWKESAHQYDFVPYTLSNSEGYKATRLELIPAGTLLTVKVAKRSSKGGDWDFLIVEVRAPSGKTYEFEEMLGNSTYFPGNVSKKWEPVDAADSAKPLADNETYFHAPNGRFSIRHSAFPSKMETWSVLESADPSSISFTFPHNALVRVDYWNHTKRQPLAGWMRDSTETQKLDRMLDAVVAFTRAKTRGMKELTLVSKFSTSASGSDSRCAVYRMRLEGGPYAGTSYRGFLVFEHGDDSYVLHFQSSASHASEQAAAEAVHSQLVALRDSTAFHSP